MANNSNRHKKPGRPIGTPGAGKYGRGIKTERIRVPIGTGEMAARLVIEIPRLLEEFESRRKDTRDWTQANKILNRIKKLVEDEKDLDIGSNEEDLD